jgi:protein ImuB
MACVDLPAFPLQVLLRRHPDWRRLPVVVVSENRSQGVVLWVNEKARRQQVRPGLRFAAALSLCHELRADEVSAEEIQTQIQARLDVLRLYAAEVEVSHEEPGVFWLDAGGLSLLHPDLRTWAGRLRQHLHRDGYVAQVAVGFTKLGTYATARAAKGLVVFASPREESQAAREVPLARLDLDPPLRDALEQLGIDTLGGFVDLPGPGVLERFGPEAHRLHRSAHGQLWSPLAAEPQPEPLIRRSRWDRAETDAGRLLHGIGVLLASLLSTLAARQQALAALSLELRTENGRRWIERLQPAHPTRDEGIVRELIQLRLAHLGLDDGVEEVTLEVEPARLETHQGDLFDRPRRDFRAGRRALARVRAELGAASVVKAVLHDRHLPEAQFTWEVLETLSPPVPRRVRRRPLVRRLYARPRQLSSPGRHEPDGWHIRGLAEGPVEEIVGPYVISGRWWQRPVWREYHYVRVGPNRWLWVYYDRHRRRWFLQGEVE